MKARREDSKQARFATVLATVLIACFVAGIHSGCEDGKMDGSNRQEGTERITREEWEKVADLKIYFGHRSVGKNIINGIMDLMAEDGAGRVNIVETTDAARFEGGIFAHSGVGKNSVPESKVEAFEEILENGVGSRADIAMLKFCFVDIKADTNANEVFMVYKEAVDRLEEEFPELTIVHFTIPLSQLKTTWKTRFKKMLGRKRIWEFDNLAAKNEYNALIRNAYGDTGALFDLAAVESTRTDGKKETFVWQGKRYEAMAAEYTDDGGHLNELGRKVVAAEMLRVLAKQGS